jgi:hypothetical protein
MDHFFAKQCGSITHGCLNLKQSELKFKLIIIAALTVTLVGMCQAPGVWAAAASLTAKIDTTIVLDIAGSYDVAFLDNSTPATRLVGGS